MGLVYSDKMKEWCIKTLQGYQLDGIPVPRFIDNHCHRVLYGNAGNTYRKTLTRHRKNTNRKKYKSQKYKSQV